jgi:hypothetical protein
MNIGALTSGDTMYNFVKLVDASRQRNISAFDVSISKPNAARSARSTSNAAQVSAFQQAFTKNKPAAADSERPSAGYQIPKVTRTKILGNFFDAYA